MLALLRDAMQLYWFLDNEGRFRIEHISFFKNGHSYTPNTNIGLDLNEVYKTKIPKKWGYLTNKYEFDITDIPSRMQFHWADKLSQAFAGFPIEPLSNFVQRGRVEDIHIRGFSSDVDLMIAAPHEFSRDGFAVMKARRIDNRNVLPFETIGNHEAQNAFMSFYWLHKKFWKHNLPTRQARINNEVVEVKEKRIKKQEVRFPLIVVNFDPQKLITTGIGNGRVAKVSESLSSNFSRVTLMHDTE